MGVVSNSDETAACSPVVTPSSRQVPRRLQPGSFALGPTTTTAHLRWPRPNATSRKLLSLDGRGSGRCELRLSGNLKPAIHASINRLTEYRHGRSGIMEETTFQGTRAREFMPGSDSGSRTDSGGGDRIFLRGTLLRWKNDRLAHRSGSSTPLISAILVRLWETLTSRSVAPIQRLSRNSIKRNCCGGIPVDARNALQVADMPSQAWDVVSWVAVPAWCSYLLWKLMQRCHWSGRRSCRRAMVRMSSGCLAALQEMLRGRWNCASTCGLCGAVGGKFAAGQHG